MSSKTVIQQAGNGLTARNIFERAHVLEGRDDTSKLNLGKAGQAYANITSKDVMEQPGGTAKKVFKRYNMIKSVTNQKGIKGFPSMDKAGKVPSAIKDSKEVVRSLLDV